MDDVTAVSGIAKPVFYRYFKDKADLFLAVGRDAAERLVTDVVAAIEVQREPREMLAAGVGAFLSGVEADPGLLPVPPRAVPRPTALPATAADQGLDQQATHHPPDRDLTTHHRSSLMSHRV